MDDTPITDLPTVNAEPPDFSDVTAQTDTTAERVRNPANDSAFARMVSGQAAPQPEGSALGRFLGQIGGREVLQGAYGLYGSLGGDAIDYAVLGPIDRKLGTNLGTGGRGYRQAASDLADSMGMYRPQTAEDRIISGVGEALTGTGLTLGIGGGLNALANMGRGAAAGTPGYAAPATNRLAEFLTAQPTLQGVSAATGSAASGAVRESGGSQGQQLAAGLIGGLSPAVGQVATAATMRGALRGTNGSQVANSLETFKASGTTPSVGQASGLRRTQAFESLLAAVPGGAGPMAAKAKAQSSQVGSRLSELASDLTPRGGTVTPTQAGNSIAKGVTGPGGFLAETKKVSDGLYGNLDAAIAPGTRVDVSNASKALADLNAAIPGAPSISRFFQNGKIQGIEGALQDDIGGLQGVLSRPGMQQQADALRDNLTRQAEGMEQAYQQQVAAVEAQNAQRASLGMNNFAPIPQRPQIPTSAQINEQVAGWLSGHVDSKLPYEALKKLRTLVGGEIENVSLASDVPRSKWKAVYAALSKDLEAAASQSPEAMRAWRRANTYYEARASRIEAIDHVIDKSGGGEKIYNAAFSGTKDGATTLRAVMQSLPGDAQKEVASAFVRRMGRAAGSQQDDSGDVFSMATFLTNWANTSKEARKVLFDRFGPNYSRNMDQIAAMASNVREGSNVFKNPSGTGPLMAMVGAVGTTGSTIGTLVATGRVGSAAAVAGGAAGAYGLTNWMARKMTDPTFVGWLAMATRLPESAIPAQATTLRQIGERRKDPDYAEAATWLEQQGEQHPQEKARANYSQ